MVFQYQTGSVEDTFTEQLEHIILDISRTYTIIM